MRASNLGDSIVCPNPIGNSISAKARSRHFRRDEFFARQFVVKGEDAVVQNFPSADLLLHHIGAADGLRRKGGSRRGIGAGSRLHYFLRIRRVVPRRGLEPPRRFRATRT